MITLLRVAARVPSSFKLRFFSHRDITTNKSRDVFSTFIAGSKNIRLLNHQSTTSVRQVRRQTATRLSSIFIRHFSFIKFPDRPEICKAQQSFKDVYALKGDKISFHSKSIVKSKEEIEQHLVFNSKIRTLFLFLTEEQILEILKTTTMYFEGLSVSDVRTIYDTVETIIDLDLLKVNFNLTYDQRWIIREGLTAFLCEMYGFE